MPLHMMKDAPELLDMRPCTVLMILGSQGPLLSSKDQRGRGVELEAGKRYEVASWLALRLVGNSMARLIDGPADMMLQWSPSKPQPKQDQGPSFRLRNTARDGRAVRTRGSAQLTHVAPGEVVEVSEEVATQLLGRDSQGNLGRGNGCDFEWLDAPEPANELLAALDAATPEARKALAVKLREMLAEG